VYAFLPLAIHAVLEAKSLELVRCDLASPEAPDKEVEGINLLVIRPGVRFCRDLAGEFLGFRDVKVGPLPLDCHMLTHGISRK
jgi:hypothetical protein